MNKRCISSLVNLSDVIGAFVSHQDGRVVAYEIPEFLALEQLQKAAHLLNQGRAAACTAVGEAHRCEFRYADHKFIVYHLQDGHLFVMCRPKANVERIDLEVKSLQSSFEELLLTATKLGTTENRNLTPSLETRNSKGKSVPREQGYGKMVPILLSVAFVLIALLGAGYFFLLGESHTSKSLATAAVIQPVTGAEKVPQKRVPSPAAETILRLHGSNTVGAKLAPALAEEYLKSELNATDVHFVPGANADEQNVEAVLQDGRAVAIEIHAHGSSTAFQDLNNELCDVGMASRSVKDAEVDVLKRFGDMKGSASEHVLALDGIAVIVHPANTIDQLTQEEIASIFSGEVSDWSQIPESSLSGRIHVFARDNKSGTWDTFKNLVLRGKPLVPTAERLEDSRELTTSVAADTNAIGFIGLPYIKPSKAISVAEKGTQAVYPTSFTVATEDYPLARRLFLYIPANPENAMSRLFVEFALGEKGQKIAKEIGFVELTISSETLEIPSTAPTEYRQLATGSSRLSLNFRFKTGSTTLDNRGTRDVDRLVRYLGQEKQKNCKIRLFGFADNIGNMDVNCRLSQVRADKVAQVLQARGIYAEKVQGFCEEMPVASNDTAAGREKNRRVEVWLGN